MNLPLQGRRILVTGIVDGQSLALSIARTLKQSGAELVCAGLGLSPHHENLSDAGRRYLTQSGASFEETVRSALGADTPTVVLDATVDATIDGAVETLAERGLALDGVLHAIAMDRTIRGGSAQPLLSVSRKDFLDCLDVSAYSLIAIVRALLARDRLRAGASIVSLSYLGAERIMSHAYRNIGVAKAALERITRELAFELGRERGIRVNAVRFSPFSASRAGGAIPDLVAAIEKAGAAAPLGNATPEGLALEVAHLMSPGHAITGEVRHVDGGYHAVA
ncbi:MAG: SDR family oxidoreductase [Myxococcota bacterium]